MVLVVDVQPYSRAHSIWHAWAMLGSAEQKALCMLAHMGEESCRLVQSIVVEVVVVLVEVLVVLVELVVNVLLDVDVEVIVEVVLVVVVVHPAQVYAHASLKALFEQAEGSNCSSTNWHCPTPVTLSPALVRLSQSGGVVVVLVVVVVVHPAHV